MAKTGASSSRLVTFWDTLLGLAHPSSPLCVLKLSVGGVETDLHSHLLGLGERHGHA
jgi:hypothetical protein